MTIEVAERKRGMFGLGANSLRRRWWWSTCGGRRVEAEAEADADAESESRLQRLICPEAARPSCWNKARAGHGRAGQDRAGQGRPAKGWMKRLVGFLGCSVCGCQEGKRVLC